MSKEATQILFPVGRYVGGSVEKGRQVEKNNVKQFNEDGTPAMDYSFGFAIAKNPGVDWKAEPWGAQILAIAQRDFPQGQWQHPTFSWKVTDGDSTVPNKKGKKPSDNEHYRGNWVLWFSSRFPVKTVNKTGSAPVPAESIKPGYFIQVLGSVRGNTGDSPGVYLNHDFVALSAYGPEITFAADASEVGFGQAPLPAGASAVPVGGMAAPSAPAPAAPPAPIPTVPHTAPMDVPPPAGPRYVLGAAAIEKGAKTVEDVLAWPGWSLEIALQHSYVIAA